MPRDVSYHKATLQSEGKHSFTADADKPSSQRSEELAVFMIGPQESELLGSFAISGIAFMSSRLFFNVCSEFICYVNRKHFTRLEDSFLLSFTLWSQR